MGGRLVGGGRMVLSITPMSLQRKAWLGFHKIYECSLKHIKYKLTSKQVELSRAKLSSLS